MNLDTIIDDIIDLSGGDLDEMDKIVGGKDKNATTPNKRGN